MTQSLASMIRKLWRHIEAIAQLFEQFVFHRHHLLVTQTYTTPSAEYPSESQKIIQNICRFPKIFRGCFIGLAFAFGGSMGQVWCIVLSRHCDPEVAQHLRNLFCVHSVLQGQDGTGVPEIRKPDVIQPGLFDDLIVQTAHHLG